MVDRLRLSRNQIARFVGNDPEAIKAIESLFRSQDTTDTDAASLSLDIGAADNKASEALSAIARLADALELAPAAIPKAPFDDLSPSRQEHVTRHAYGWFSDTTDQTAAAINTAYAMTFNTTGEAQDMRIGTPSSRIVIDRRGVYNIQFSAQFVNNSGGSAHRVWVWLRVNGTNVADSATVLRLQGNNTEQVAAWNFVQRFNAGDYFELMWEVSDTAVSLFADPASAVHPAIPSILLSVTDNINP
jgi:hypothetical protein